MNKSQKKIDGAKLCCYFAYKPNQLQYCGSDSANKNIYKCLTQDKCNNLLEDFKSFKALYPYLNTFANRTKLDLLDRRSVEAYWIGNSLLEEFEHTDFDFLLNQLKVQGVPGFFLKELRDKIVKNNVAFIPHHSFNVIFVGVGNVTGSVKYNIENINNCLIRSGKIKSIESNQLTLHTTKLGLNENTKLYFKDGVESAVFDKKIVSDIKVGDIVSIHWNDVVKKITKEESNSLSHWNKITIENYNKSMLSLDLS